MYKKILISILLISPYGYTKNDSLPTYIVGTDAVNPPMNTRDELGSATGFEVDLLKAIGEKKGFNIEVRVHALSTLLSELSKGSIDVISDVISISDKYKEKYTFTDPYIFKSRIAILPKNIVDNKGIQEFQDIKDLIVAVQENTSKERYLVKTFGEDIKLLPVKTQFLAFKAIFTKKAEAAYGDDLNIRYFSKNHPEISWLELSENKKVPVGFLLNKGNTQLRDIINQGLREVYYDGTYQKIAQKWLDKKTEKDNLISIP